MLRPFARGFRDTLDNLLPLTLASMAWWIGLLLVVTAPAATVALFARCDPRRLDDHLAVTREEALQIVRRELGAAWVLALGFAVPAAVLINNLVTYSGREGAIRWLLPLWVVLLLLLIAAAGIACALRANHGSSISSAMRQAAIMVLARPHRVLPVAIVLWVVVAMGGVLVVPAIMFVPALVATTVNHVVYDAMGIPIADPMDLTPERRAENERAKGGKYSVG